MQNLNMAYHIHTSLNVATGDVKALEDTSGSLHNNLNTTDLTGEYGDNEYVLTRGDTRISVTLPYDNDTIRLNRKNRFLIDSFDSPNVLAYELTKPFKLGGVGGAYGQSGIVTYVMQECNTEDTDNFELHIANYYKYFPREDNKSSQTSQIESTEASSSESSEKRWF